MTRTHAVWDSPLGQVVATEDDGGVLRLGVRVDPRPDDGERDDDGTLPALREQLDAYWRHELTDFDVPLQLAGTPFQQRVWAALRTIPYGTTWSYRDLAEHIGAPTAVRAVGAANGRNPVWLVVPCHRVIASSGALTGYAGGLDVKRWLLDHERAGLWH
ncbi:MAG: methylated-DNA--[protein]-cysteine S-methyltransferase [Actinomycetes bacterium]